MKNVKKSGDFQFLTNFFSFLFDDQETEKKMKLSRNLEKLQVHLINFYQSIINFEQYQQENTSNSLDGAFSGSSSSSAASSAAAVGQFLRNPVNGKLTLKAKGLISQRMFTCSAKDLDSQKVFSSDPINRPICSFEIFPNWTRRLIHWSKALNAHFLLPVNSLFLHNHWGEIYLFYYQELLKEIHLRHHPLVPPAPAASTTTPAGTTGSTTTTNNNNSSNNKEEAAAAKERDFLTKAQDWLEETVLFYPTIFSRVLRNCFRFNLRFLGEYAVLLAVLLLVALLLAKNPLPALGLSWKAALVPVLLAGYVTALYWQR